MPSVSPGVDSPDLTTCPTPDRMWTGQHWTAALYWETTGPDAEALSWLSPDELARYTRMAQPTARERFVTGRGLARRVVAHRLGCAPADIAFAYRCGHCGGAHGKPEVVESGVAFSLSHSASRVGLAMVTPTGGAPGAVLLSVGLDVERLTDHDFDSVASVALSLSEQRVLARCPPVVRPAAVLRYWTRKESVLKALGVGLSRPPASIEVSAPGASATVLNWSGAQLIELADVPVPGDSAGDTYLASVCVLTEFPR